MNASRSTSAGSSLIALLAAGLLLFSGLPAAAQGEEDEPPPLTEVGKAFLLMRQQVSRLQRDPKFRGKQEEMRQDVRKLREAFVAQGEPKIKTAQDMTLVARVLRVLGKDGRAAILYGKAYKKAPNGEHAVRAGYQQIEALYKKMQYEQVAALARAYLERFPNASRRNDLVWMYRRIQSRKKRGRMLGFGAASLEVSRAIGLKGKFKWSDYRGKVVFLFFFGSYEERSRADIAKLKALKARYGDKLAILGATGYFRSVWLGGKPVKATAAGDEFNLLKKFHEEQALPFPILLTPEKVRDEVYRIGQVPFYVLIDRNGIVRNGQNAFSKWSTVEEALKVLIDEQLPPRGGK